ncbi:MAG: polysaccharide deacetylase [Lachnospiraceae bacterium]|nr:polysaccharide deacetylase [Lachnospiraceae bacterium]
MSDKIKLTDERRKRIKILKKIIVFAIFSAVILPSVFCIILMVKLSETRRQMTDLEERLISQEELLLIMAQEAEAEAILEVVETSIFHTARLEESGRRRTTPVSEVSEQNIERRIYLTFDDGPSINTGRILDILKEYDVKATFFVVGKTDERSFDLYRRIVNEGHTLGMHSYSHRYQEIYQSVEAFSDDLSRLQELLYEVTGVWCRYYRFPGGSSNTVSRIDMQDLINYLREKDITYFDWNIGSGDAATGYVSAQRIINNCMTGLRDKTNGIILMHDTAEKSSTVSALPRIIEGILALENTALLPISDDTFAVQHITN